MTTLPRKRGRPRKWTGKDAAGKSLAQLYDEFSKSEIRPVIVFETIRAELAARPGQDRYKLALDEAAAKCGVSRSALERARRKWPDFRYMAFKLNPSDRKRLERMMAENPDDPANLEFFRQCYRRSRLGELLKV
ncbi:MAG: hypothetical protein SFV54_21320 [Bryobacteraceae bacterium]|nr:hypothetical protein [Bryobacteraceae bacterium]